MEENSQTSYEVRFTATTYHYRSAVPKTKQWIRRFSFVYEAMAFVGEVKRAMTLPRYEEFCDEDVETQQEWTDLQLGEDGCIESFDGIWEVKESCRLLDDEEAEAIRRTEVRFV